MNEGKSTGNALTSLLLARMRIDGVSVSTLGSKLGISQGYLSQLLSGKKCVAMANDKFLRSCAQYLGLPSVTCFLMAGRLRREDFFDMQEDYIARLEKALRVVSVSPCAQEVAVSFEQLKALPASIQHMVILLYETAAGVELMTGRVGRDAIEMAASKVRMPFEIRLNRST